jgi:hypothetical protein
VIGHQVKKPSLSPSIGHQTLDLPSFPFSLFLKGKLKSLEALFFPRHNFQFNLENIYSHKFLEEKNDQSW